jgi:hypothetical protein
MDYTQIGYDDFLIRPLEATYTEQIGIDTGGAIGQVSGNQVRGDQILSLNKSLNIDLQNDSFIISDNNINRVELGRLADGNIGIIIRDDQGKEMLNISALDNKITSADGHMVLDFNEEQLIIYDETMTPRVLLGKGNF